MLFTCTIFVSLEMKIKKGDSMASQPSQPSQVSQFTKNRTSTDRVDLSRSSDECQCFSVSVFQCFSQCWLFSFCGFLVEDVVVLCLLLLVFSCFCYTKNGQLLFLMFFHRKNTENSLIVGVSGS